MQIPDALDRNGMPSHKGGQSQTVSGLYFLGLGWLRSRNSAFMGGVGTDVKVIIDRIAGTAKTDAARDTSEARR
ncbi:hypothetical protein [Microcella pacifica]|uniref:Uncharacterized protein n=1 Tax=Microcella pacifica TaxID=2591847 RepID=A0A9E5JLH3_9MICO|nr:hypothetical protein [Microcella pacifica]NHF62798.1 hypothetical protein [Microcella pacifica]